MLYVWNGWMGARKGKGKARKIGYLLKPIAKYIAIALLLYYCLVLVLSLSLSFLFPIHYLSEWERKERRRAGQTRPRTVCNFTYLNSQ